MWIKTTKHTRVEVNCDFCGAKFTIRGRDWKYVNAHDGWKKIQCPCCDRWCKIAKIHNEEEKRKELIECRK